MQRMTVQAERGNFAGTLSKIANMRAARMKKTVNAGGGGGGGGGATEMKEKDVTLKEIGTAEKKVNVSSDFFAAELDWQDG